MSRGGSKKGTRYRATFLILILIQFLDYSQRLRAHHPPLAKIKKRYQVPSSHLAGGGKKQKKGTRYRATFLILIQFLEKKVPGTELLQKMKRL